MYTETCMTFSNQYFGIFFNGSNLDLGGTLDIDLHFSHVHHKRVGNFLQMYIAAIFAILAKREVINQNLLKNLLACQHFSLLDLSHHSNLRAFFLPFQR